jgi:hypothetical protein
MTEHEVVALVAEVRVLPVHLVARSDVKTACAGR